MNTLHLLPAPVRAVVITLLLALAGLWAAPRALGQANASPPERMSYQGFLADGDGNALATNAPRNYDVVFRIWNDASATAAGNRLWTEQQTVTVDKGNFSVLLGEGTAVGGEAHNKLSTLFTNATASDRFVEMTVKGIGAAGADVRILPRLRLLSAPYAFLAQNAFSAKKLVNSSGADLITSINNAVTVNGTISASSFTGSGAGLTGLAASQIPALDASKINSGTLLPAQIPNLDASKITSGTLAAARISDLDGSKITTGTINDARIPTFLSGKVFTNDSFVNGRFNVNSGSFADVTVAITRRPADGNALILTDGNALKPGGGTWLAISDKRLKTVLGNFKHGLNEITKLDVVRFRYQENAAKGLSSKEEYTGFVAQDVQSVLPEAVSAMSDGYLTLNMDVIYQAGVNAIKELDMQTKALRDDNATLKRRIAELEAKDSARDSRLGALENLVKTLARSNTGPGASR